MNEHPIPVYAGPTPSYHSPVTSERWLPPHQARGVGDRSARAIRALFGDRRPLTEDRVLIARVRS